MNRTDTFIHKIHFEIAQEGQRFALTGKYNLALERFREALRQAQTLKAPHIFARYYVQGVLECLEKLYAHEAVAALCRRLIEAQVMAGQESEFHRRDRAVLLEKIGVAELGAGRSREAAEAFREAVAVAAPGRQPFSECMAGWLARRQTITPTRLADAQRRYSYFALRADSEFHSTLPKDR